MSVTLIPKEPLEYNVNGVSVFPSTRTCTQTGVTCPFGFVEGCVVEYVIDTERTEVDKRVAVRAKKEAFECGDKWRL